MWLITTKNGKFWPKEYINGEYRFLSKERRDLWYKQEQEVFEKIVAKVYNDAFKSRCKPA